MGSYGTVISLDWFARLFVRHRMLLSAAVFVVTLVSAVGYFPNHPTFEWKSKRDRPAKSERAKPTAEKESAAEQPPTQTSPPASGSGMQWDSPEPSRSDEVADNFNLQRSEAFLVVETDKLFTPEAISAIRAMVDAVEQLPIVDSVFWADDVPMLNVFGFADPLFPEEGSSAESYVEAREKLLKHPLVAGQLLSPDGRTLMMPLVYDWIHLGEDEDSTELVLQTARKALDTSLSQANPASPKITVGLTGNVPLFLAQKQAFQHNQWLFRVIGYGMTTLLAIILFRGFAAVVIVSLAPALGIFWTFGIFALFDIEVNDLSVAVLPVLISMVGFTDGVHLMIHIRNGRAQGLSEIEAVTQTISKVGMACALTSLTTAIGFASLYNANSEFVQSFGIAGCLGVVIAFVAVVTSVPLFCVCRLGRNIHSGHQHDIVGQNLHRFEKQIVWILDHRGWVTATAVIVTLVTAAISATLRPDARLENTMPASTPAYETLAHCDDVFGGIQFVRVLVKWNDSVPDDSQEILASIHEVEKLIDEQPLMKHPLSIRNMLATFPGDPGDLSTQMTFLSLLPRDLKRFFFNENSNEAVVTARIQDVGIAVYEPVFDEVEQKLSRLQAGHTGITFELDGEPVKRSRDLTRIVTDLSNSLMTASVVIFVVMAIAYQSIRLGLICIVPNLFPLTITGTMLVLSGSHLDIASVCSFVVCLGIAVDDTIHFLSRFQVEINQPPEDPADMRRHVDSAIRRSFMGVGTAMIVTTIILIAGFSTVLTSDLRAHRTFAGMACSTIAAALVGDLIFLPAMLALFTRHKFKKEKPPVGDIGPDPGGENNPYRAP